ncbi:MAG: hypothetical protein FWG98_10595 [Candidatus Cloacimonetes bacterium]|nr:hypothetical protein [Candidatus Cloacimonadota bacterium]
MRKLILRENRTFPMRKITRFVLFLVVATALMLVACSEKDDNPFIQEDDRPPTLSNTPDDSILFPPRDHQFAENLIVVLPEVNFSATNTQNDVKAVPLDFFFLPQIENQINFESDAQMYTYRIVASDGWNPWKDRQAKDLYWDEYKTGYLVLNDDIQDRNHFRSYFHEMSQESVYSYNVQNTHELQLYRTIKVVKLDGEEVMFHLNILDHQEIENPQNENSMDKSFKLQDLITGYITKTPEQFEYEAISVDDRSFTFTWPQLQTAYYSRDIDRIFFPFTEEFTGQMRLRDLVRVEVRNRQ